MNIEVSPKEYERKMNWDDAMMYCQLLVIDDKCDWRLPTKDELNYIYYSENDFDDVYWSSTEGNGKEVWGQNMSGGGQGYSDKGYSYYVRPVRNI